MHDYVSAKGLCAHAPLAVLMLLCGIGCAPGPAPAHQTVFRLNLEGGLKSLDPAFADDQAVWWMTAQLFNGLVAFDSALNVVPAIAHRWEISPDGRTYTFWLRTDVWFHPDPCFGPDSTRRVVASDVVYSFQRLLDTALAAPGRWILAGRLRHDAARPGFTAVNDSVFQLELKTPFSPFLGQLAMPFAAVLPYEALRTYGVDFRRHPVGTGPFRFFRWDEGRALILHRNPRYFEHGLPYLDAVQARFMPSKMAAFVALRHGELDFLNDLDPSYADEVLTPTGRVQPAFEADFKVLRAPQLNTEYIGVLIDTALPQLRHHPLADVRVRQAIGYAIDRQALVRHLRKGMGQAATAGMVPPGLPGFDSVRVRGFGHDPAKARSLLAQAGYPGGKGLPKMTLCIKPDQKLLGELLQAAWARIGVDIAPEVLLPQALRRKILHQEVRLWRASWIADYPDAENYLQLFHTLKFAPKGRNTTHFSDPVCDSLYDQYVQMPSQGPQHAAARAKVCARIEARVMAQAPVIPLYYDRSIRIVPKHVHGLGTHPMNVLDLKRVRLGHP